MKAPKVVFSDFDGTLTSGPYLGPLFFELIELLEKNSIPLVIVTGRSLSWAHFLLTHTPLKVVAAESGAVICSKVDLDSFKEDFLVSESSLLKLNNFTQKLLNTFKGLELTSDSLGRVCDRAIRLSVLENSGLENEILKMMDDNDISYSKSSVHLNFWAGTIKKSIAIKTSLNQFFDGVQEDDIVYFGDAANDQTVFKDFKHTVGVSNIKYFLDKMECHPSIILEGDQNSGVRGVLNYLKKFFS